MQILSVTYFPTDKTVDAANSLIPPIPRSYFLPLLDIQKWNLALTVSIIDALCVTIEDSSNIMGSCCELSILCLDTQIIMLTYDGLCVDNEFLGV